MLSIGVVSTLVRVARSHSDPASENQAIQVYQLLTVRLKSLCRLFQKLETEHKTTEAMTF